MPSEAIEQFALAVTWRINLNGRLPSLATSEDEQGLSVYGCELPVPLGAGHWATIKVSLIKTMQRDAALASTNLVSISRLL